MHHGAGVIVVRPDGAVLMQHRDNKPGIFYPDYYCYPAGSVNTNESFEEAAKRELSEETGYVPDQLYFLANEIYTRSDNQKINRHIYWTIYDQKQVIQCNEGQEMKFVSLGEFSGKKFLPGHEKLFRLAIKKARVKLGFSASNH